MELSRWKNIFKKEEEDADIIEIIKKVPLFDYLNKKELTKISHIVYAREYKAEEYLFKEGTPGSALFIIKTGNVSIEKISENGETLVLASISEEDFLGELSLLNEIPRSASARCKTITKAVVLFKHELFELIKSEPRTGIKILKNLAMMTGKRLVSTTNELITCKKLLEGSNE